jgi:glycerophosphoryl diester phosphodiesterase
LRPNASAWLVERPIAHRGLHDAKRGLIENTIGAAEAAIASGFAIECDVQLSADGEAIVFHDPLLDRISEGSGALASLTVAQIKAAPFRRSPERAPTLPEFLAAVRGRTPIVCEIKSGFEGDFRIVERVAALAAEYQGPLALKSFDPEAIVYLRERHGGLGPAGSPCPLGVVAEASYKGAYWRALSVDQKRSCAEFLHFPRSRPDFLSWNVKDLPNSTPFLLRALRAMPVIAWTVKSRAQRAAAALWADQIVFEGAGRP